MNLSIQPGLSQECLQHLKSTVSMTTVSTRPHPANIQELCHHVAQCYLCGILSLQMKNLFDTVLDCNDGQHYKRAPYGGAGRRYDAVLQALSSKLAGGKKRSGAPEDNDDWGRYDSEDTMSPYSVPNEIRKGGGLFEDSKLTGNVNKRQAEAVGDGGIYPFVDNTLGAFASDLALQTYAAMLKQDYRQIRGDNRSGRRTRPFVG